MGHALLAIDRNTREDLTSMIRQGLEAMPDLQRQVFLLRQYQGMTIDEISLQLGMMPERISRLLSEARKNLSLHLKGYRLS